MRLLAPLGPVYQAGTLSGNPLAMAAGIATVGTLIEQRDTIYPRLEQVSATVAEGVAGIASQAGVAVTTNRVGSMFTWFFSGDAVTDYDSASRSNTKQFAAFHNAMMRAGVWLPPSQFEAAFLGTAHGEEEIRATLAAAKDALSAAKSA
jgi:glutamate-1-semialdehyde 2,1-aminomutase